MNSEILRLCPTPSGQAEEHNPKRTYLPYWASYTDKFWGKIGERGVALSQIRAPHQKKENSARALWRVI